MKKARLIKRGELIQTLRDEKPQPNQESTMRLSVVRAKSWVNDRRSKQRRSPREAFAALFAHSHTG